jgi:hypothetical protein
MYENSGYKCWEDEGSLCGKHGVEDFNLLQATVKNKIEACKFCVYYNLVNQISNHLRKSILKALPHD